MKTLFYGGTILTLAEPATVPGLLVENGEILALGEPEILRRGQRELQEVDLRGRVLMPAFIDAHSHIFQVALSFLQVDLEGVTSAAQMKERVDAFLEEQHPAPGTWLNARGYDNNRMPRGENPTLEELDRLAPDHPMIIHHKSGHMGLLNSQALKKLGITADTPSPQGGRIEVKDGALTGYLEENAFFTCIRQVPVPGPEILLRAFDRAQQKYASYGITTVQDGMVAAEMLPLYEVLARENRLALDVYLYMDPRAYEAGKALVARLPENSRLHIGGMKIFLDGSPQGRTAWMRSPYAGEETYCGYGTMSDEAVEAAFLQAGRAGAQLICHCNGDGAAEQFLRCLERAEKTCPALKSLRPVIIHGQLMGLDQLARARELGAMVSFFVAHTYHWGDVHLKNFGPERAEHISPCASALQAGLRFTFHQDAPVIEPDMLETLWCAENRITREGRVLGPQERITHLEALKAVTVHAAWQYFREGRLGQLLPGSRGDLVVLDGNPLEVPDVRTIRVLETYKEGTSIYRAEEA